MVSLSSKKMLLGDKVLYGYTIVVINTSVTFSDRVSTRGIMGWQALLVPPVFGCISNERSPVAILGVPLDTTATYRPGTRFAPSRIREAACNLELYSLLADLSLETLGYKDYGDLNLPPGSVEKSLEHVKIAIKNIREEHEHFLIILGGEHLLTYPALQAFKEAVDTVVVFDAHLDCRDEYLGSRLNHATFLRRVAESGFRVIHFGSRAYSSEEMDFAKGSGIEVYNVFRVKNESVKISDLGHVYISIDVDVFDPSIAPGVSNPEPFGLDLETFAKLLVNVFENSREVVAADIVEVNPLVDNSNITSILAAKIGIELTGLYMRKTRLP